MIDFKTLLLLTPCSPSLTFELQQFFPLSSWILFMISAATSS
uniref:Uncharacterized protein n=1 Tax=Moniliophthora roreri TaxID=221103 RepID=A0A0W0F772_MONRR